MTNHEKMKSFTARAKEGARELAILSTERKNRVLIQMAESINSSKDMIKSANKIDMEKAVKTGKNSAYLERLTLNDKRIDAMSSMMKDVACLPDPVGAIMETILRPNGLRIDKVRVPIGVIGIIYESRPNVTADSAALCLKSGNSVILRGGSDAIESNKAIYTAMRLAVVKEGINEGVFLLIEDTSRELVDEMLAALYGIDLIMPRGGESLINEVSKKSKIPVIKHYKGICHVYVDEYADFKMAEEICFNAKVQRPGVCNAMETMLGQEKKALDFLPDMVNRFIKAGVKIKACETARKILAGRGFLVESARDSDFATEYLDLILNVKIVKSVDEAIKHINTFGSNHSDSICPSDKKNAEKFTKEVDSAAVYVNASTRFTDGGEFGKGAEIGISTDKLHARGPMGLEELTTYKYIVHGNGQIRT
ncbi:Glutamate-5-semialdehyde dehydrogenase [Candidatus Omnitrophus magneticus]|uniref:Gamma-glutamyl phosphate reductase n=1 Tax=Candidatus Omnitrophus magneticus TaxID=1609969 RepID=A0A0F0CRB7_9BACT|nr:Glutamate-5-semialdehyde dehydrogenase [Candidatus Omnitrophus magneticus]